MSFVSTVHRNNRIQYGNRLFDCDRCGFTHHLRDTIVQNGIRIGKDSCKDEIITGKRVTI